MDDITYGGFSKENIRNWILAECLVSGSPAQFFRCIVEACDDIDDEWNDYGQGYWDSKMYLLEEENG